MQTIKKQINSYTIEVTIKESHAEFLKTKEQVIKELSENANIK